MSSVNGENSMASPFAPAVDMMKVGHRAAYACGDPLFQTTPSAIDAHVETFCFELGGLKAGYVPVLPAPGSENGFCHRNVTEQVARHGGRAAFGWAMWVNQLFLMGEFHVVWISPGGAVVDVTPAAEGETEIVFAPDEEYPADFDFTTRPPNRAMRIVGQTDPTAISQAINELSPAQRAYEERRAAKKGLDLASHLASKAKPSELAEAVDNLIRWCAVRDRLVVPTSSGVYSPDPEAFLVVQSRVSELEVRILRAKSA